jgi:hypothetical protein
MPDYTPTFADLCSAIADGGVIATLDGSVYEINAFELRRYFYKSRTLPGAPSQTEDALLTEGNLDQLQNPRLMQRH